MTPKQMISEHRRRHNIMAGHYWVELAEQMGAEIDRLTIALAAQTTQHVYPCSPHCAGYLREQQLRAALTDASAKLHKWGDWDEPSGMLLADLASEIDAALAHT